MYFWSGLLHMVLHVTAYVESCTISAEFQCYPKNRESILVLLVKCWVYFCSSGTKQWICANVVCAIILKCPRTFFKCSTFVGSAWSLGFFIPPQRPMTSDFEGFLYQILFITLFSYLHSWERASISLLNVQC